MHQFLINAAIQIVPIVNDRHPYEWVDEAIEVIKQSGIDYEVGAFATVVEGTYDSVMKVVHSVNEHLFIRSCGEWIVNLQVQLRYDRDITAVEKTAKHAV